MHRSSTSVGHFFLYLIAILMYFSLALYLVLIVITVLVILMSVFHKEIVNWLKPAAEWMHRCVYPPPPLVNVFDLSA